MPRGRPPKSIALHLAQGTYRNDRHGARAKAEQIVAAAPALAPIALAMGEASARHHQARQALIRLMRNRRAMCDPASEVALAARLYERIADQSLGTMLQLRKALPPG